MPFASLYSLTFIRRNNQRTNIKSLKFNFSTARLPEFSSAISVYSYLLTTAQHDSDMKFKVADGTPSRWQPDGSLTSDHSSAASCHTSRGYYSAHVEDNSDANEPYYSQSDESEIESDPSPDIVDNEKALQVEGMNSHATGGQQVKDRNCEDCESPQSNNVSWCQDCKMRFCENCWPRAPPHKRKIKGHEKVDLETLYMLQSLMGKKENDRQEHLQAEGSRWFGINFNGPVALDITERYRKIAMANTDIRHREAYPALVSFVGETGAGKSSLVNALIKVSTSPPPHTSLSR